MPTQLTKHPPSTKVPEAERGCWFPAEYWLRAAHIDRDSGSLITPCDNDSSVIRSMLSKIAHLAGLVRRRQPARSPSNRHQRPYADSDRTAALREASTTKVGPE